VNEIESYFSENCYVFDREAIYKLNERDNGPLNNVLSHLKESCYGIQIFDEKEIIKYEIFYIDYKHDLKGFGLFLSLNLEETVRREYIIEFCIILKHEFPHVDIIDAFNTFQIESRTAFEKFGFFTFGNEISKFEGKNATVIIPPSFKGHLLFRTLVKLNVYRWLFGEDEENVKIDESKTKKIYLILDSKNNLIKIGQSFNPNKREKTLQGVFPQWDLITTWIAPVSVEKELHNKFRQKRTRGEWFKLTFSDLEEIKEYMSKYKNSL
jgi:hypothetical protein